MFSRKICTYNNVCFIVFLFFIFITTDEFSVRVTKITSRIGSSWAHSLLLCFLSILTQWIMAIVSKGCKPDNFELHNFLKHSFTNICGLCLNWMWIFLCIKLSWHSGSMWGKLKWLNWFWQFLCYRLSFFNLKGLYYSFVWSCSLCEERTSFGMGLISRNLCRFLLMFSTGFTSFSILLLFSLLITFFIFMHGFWFMVL